MLPSKTNNYKHMKQMKFFIAAVLIIVNYTVFAQGVSINEGGATADGSAMLDVKSDSKGILIPRMTETQRNDITTPATGLMIFQTDGISGFYYYDGSVWKVIGEGGGTTPSYSVGDFAQGGIVFWVDETGQHGLACAKTDQNSGNAIRWYAGTFGSTHSKGDGPFAGEANTSIIIAAEIAIGDDGNSYAARICNELQITEGGKTYGDWYLPSNEELNLMYQNKSTINTTAGNNGGSSFAENYYWSSTDYTTNNALHQLFSDGAQNSYEKSNANMVRAVRAF